MLLRFLLSAFLLIGGVADARMTLTGAGAASSVITPLIFTTLAGGTVGGSAIAGSGTYTGTAPSSISTATWSGCGGGSSTPGSFSASSGTWSATFTVPGSAGSGCTITIVDNLGDSGTSPGVTITGAAFWTLVINTMIADGTGIPPLVSPPVDTRTATIIDVCVERYQGVAAPVLTDSLLNTWIPLSEIVGANSAVRLYYALNPIVGAVHTFTLNNGGNFYGGGQIAAFKGSVTPTYSGLQNGATGVVNHVQPGIVTPGVANALLVACVGTGFTGTTTADSGFSITDSQGNGAGVGGALGWLSQSVAAGINPTLTTAGSQSAADENATIAVFVP